MLLIGSASSFNVFKQLFYRKMQIDIEIRLGGLQIDDGEELFKQLHLIIFQIIFTEYEGFRQEIIAYYSLSEKIRMSQLGLDLMVSFRKKGELKLEGIAVRILIEFCQEGIITESLQHQAAA